MKISGLVTLGLLGLCAASTLKQSDDNSFGERSGRQSRSIIPLTILGGISAFRMFQRGTLGTIGLPYIEDTGRQQQSQRSRYQTYTGRPFSARTPFNEGRAEPAYFNEFDSVPAVFDDGSDSIDESYRGQPTLY